MTRNHGVAARDYGESFADFDNALPDVSADLLALTSFDAVQGIRRIGGKAEAYRKQLRRFREYHAGAVDELQSLIANNGMAAGELFCHAFKGVCGNLGANELFACAAEVDALLKRGRIPEPEQIERLRQLLQQAMNEIDGLPPSDATRPAATAALSRDEFLAKLAALMSLLENDFGAAELLLADLRSDAIDTNVAPAVREIAAKVDVFEIDEALAGIDALRSRLSATDKTLWNAKS